MGSRGKRDLKRRNDQLMGRQGVGAPGGHVQKWRGTKEKSTEKRDQSRRRNSGLMGDPMKVPGASDKQRS